MIRADRGRATRPGPTTIRGEHQALVLLQPLLSQCIELNAIRTPHQPIE